MRQTIAICTPTLGIVSMRWSCATGSILWPNNCAKALFPMIDKVGGEIAEVRNAIVQNVLEYDAKVSPVSHLFWVDDDVLVFPGCLRELLHRNVDICSGVYFTKLPDRLSCPLIYPDKYGGTSFFRPDDFFATWGHGLGIALIRTEVYKRVRDELDLGVDKYGKPKWHHTTSDDDPVVQDENGCIEMGWTEDLYFLDKVHQLGIQSYVDTSKHAFGWHHNRDTDQGYPTPQWRDWLNGLPVTWETPNGPVVWT